MNKEQLKDYILDLQAKKDIPEIRPGYVVTISERITEGKKTRIQKFQGIVISYNKKGSISRNLLLRKKIDEIWIEKRFFLNNPLIEDIKVDSVAKARRAKLYYLRNYRGLTERMKRLKRT